jgi:WD40 repeat protein
VSFPRPGKPFESARPGEIWLWDVSRRPYVKRAVLKEARKVPRSLAYSLDGSRLAFGDGDVARVIDAGTGRRLGTFEGHTSFVVSVAFTPDGKRAISGGYDKAVRLWDATTMEQVHVYEGHDGYVEQVAVSHDGRLAASCGHDKTVRLWRPPTMASDGKSR